MAQAIAATSIANPTDGTETAKTVFEQLLWEHDQVTAQLLHVGRQLFQPGQSRMMDDLDATIAEIGADLGRGHDDDLVLEQRKATRVLVTTMVRAFEDQHH